MFTRFADAIPQAMQRHTGTSWEPCEQRRMKKLPTPAEPPRAEAAAEALKKAARRVSEPVKQQ